MPVDLNRLKNQLASTKVRDTDFTLFQVLNQLIDYLRKDLGQTNVTVSNTGGTVTGLLTKSFLTANDETGILTQSRRLLAGNNVTFDDSVSGERTINVAATSSRWSVLTDGDPIEPELIFADGDVIMLEYPE